MKKRLLLVQFAPDFSGSTISGHLIAEGLVKSGWDVHVVFAGEGPYIGRYRESGCRTHVVAHKSWLRTRSWPRFVKRLQPEIAAAREMTGLIRAVRPDVVYVNTLVSFAGALAAKRCGVPCVWHIRELFDDVGGEAVPPRPGGKRLVRRVLSHLADRLVVISRSVAENVVGSTDRPNLSIVPNAVQDAFFDIDRSPAACRAALGLPQDGSLVGVPGTLRPVKGHRFFLEATELLLREQPACHMAITGTGEPAYSQALRDDVAARGLAGRVHFLGNVTDMPAFYRACDVVCVPSRSESFGRTVIEAFAAGTPVVGTAVGGIRETIEHGRTGLTVEYGQPRQLAAAVASLLNDTALAHRLAEAAHQQAQRLYREAVYQQRISETVEQAASLGHARVVDG